MHIAGPGGFLDIKNGAWQHIDILAWPFLSPAYFSHDSLCGKWHFSPAAASVPVNALAGRPISFGSLLPSLPSSAESHCHSKRTWTKSSGMPLSRYSTYLELTVLSVDKIGEDGEASFGKGTGRGPLRKAEEALQIGQCFGGVGAKLLMSSPTGEAN